MPVRLGPRRVSGLFGSRARVRQSAPSPPPAAARPEARSDRATKVTDLQARRGFCAHAPSAAQGFKTTAPLGNERVPRQHARRPGGRVRLRFPQDGAWAPSLNNSRSFRLRPGLPNSRDDPLRECGILLQESEKRSHNVARVRLEVEGELFQKAMLLTSQVYRKADSPIRACPRGSDTWRTFVASPAIRTTHRGPTSSSWTASGLATCPRQVAFDLERLFRRTLPQAAAAIFGRPSAPVREPRHC
jgi:hypothetical protein